MLSGPPCPPPQMYDVLWISFAAAIISLTGRGALIGASASPVAGSITAWSRFVYFSVASSAAPTIAEPPPMGAVPNPVKLVNAFASPGRV